MDEPDPALRELLKAEADRYEPDHERIMRRIRRPQPPTEPVRLDDRRSRRLDHPMRDLQRRRERRTAGLLIPVVAASLVALIAGTIAALDRFDSAPSKPVSVAAQQTPANVTPSTPTPASSAPAASTAADPTTPDAEVGAPVSSSAPATRTPHTTAGAPPPPTAPIAVDVAPAPAGRAVTLSGAATDWVVAGALPYNALVRHKDVPQLISGPHIQGGDPKPGSEEGPFSVSWSGGMPDQSGSANTKWYVVHGPPAGPESGMLVRVPAGAKAGEVVVQVGAKKVDGRLKVSLDDGKNLSTYKLKAGPTGYTVTVRFHTSGAPGELTVELVAGAGGSVGLASVVLK
jgi:hypothetical protein